MRILSLLPAATEMVFLLGLGDDLVGVSHECDYPSQAAIKPRVTRSRVDAGRPGDEIQRQVQELSHDHNSLYELDVELIRALKPDLILTQEICEVCAVSRAQVEASAVELYGTPNVVSMEPSTLNGVLDDISYLGELTNRRDEAAAKTTRLRERIERVKQIAQTEPAAVVCLEWLQPPMAAGHWIPEMIELAGGRDPIMSTGDRSRRLAWEEVRGASPDVLIIAPCGYNLFKAVEEYRNTELPAWWPELPA
ncbi:MAG TPA: ABC transporter substrate-binding protein, partial [Dehalococcoidia bacterium]|nr:ABC transporter substrate-binding protein [Dehalococcoidia bacterium]